MPNLLDYISVTLDLRLLPGMRQYSRQRHGEKRRT
jgi:hypothetical protein